MATSETSRKKQGGVVWCCSRDVTVVQLSGEVVVVSSYPPPLTAVCLYYVAMPRGCVLLHFLDFLDFLPASTHGRSATFLVFEIPCLLLLISRLQGAREHETFTPPARFATFCFIVTRYRYPSRVVVHTARNATSNGLFLRRSSPISVLSTPKVQTFLVLADRCVRNIRKSYTR